MELDSNLDGELPLFQTMYWAPEEHWEVNMILFKLRETPYPHPDPGQGSDKDLQLVGAAVVELELSADKYLPCLLGSQLQF